LTKRIKNRNSDFVNKHEPSWSRRIARGLSDHIKNNPSSYAIKLPELMSMFKLKYDSEVIHDYGLIQQFFVNHRKYAMNMFKHLIDSGWFERYLNNGHSEAEIYQSFIDKCINEQPPIIPLYCDIDSKYKLIDLNSFLLMLESRLKATGKEMTRKFKYFKNTYDVLPKTISNELNQLNTNDNFDILKSARDELNKFLPDSKEETENV